MALPLCLLLAGSAASEPVAHTPLRKPPMGFSSWNHFGMGVTAPLLLDVADAFAQTGLRGAGYLYINTDDGWLDFNRSGTAAALQPSSHFTNDSLQALTSALHAKHFKFGIYLAAGFTTCGRRAGSLYHERSDAAQIAAAGVDYLKYDDCGEANIQSYAKYFAMKDALDAAYGPDGVDYYSFEPFQVYGPGAVEQMRWVSMWEGAPGVLWRSGGDIRAQWRSILGNAHANNKWAPNAKPGRYNDADMLEVGNGQLTLAEQRSHFALWCVMKSPLIIGSDVRALSTASLEILMNPRLIEVNQDALMVQGTLRLAMDASGERAPLVPARTVNCVTTPCAQPSPWMTHCSFGNALPSQHWALSPDGRQLSLLSNADADGPRKCLARSSSQPGAAVHVALCHEGNPMQDWDFGAANETVAQVRGGGECLTFNASALSMAPCHTEAGDKTTPNESGCTDGACRFSGIVHQLWYLNSLGQMTSAITNIPNGGSTLLPMLQDFPPNTPWCLATEHNTAAPPAPPPAVDSSMPLQVWAGPLEGGDVVVLLLNAGNGTAMIKALFADIGLGSNVTAVKAVDLWTGKSAGLMSGSYISASVASHDSAVMRLSPCQNECA